MNETMGAAMTGNGWASDSGGVVDHDEIDAREVVERYLEGRLPADEAAQFEEHSLACPRCLDRLEGEEALRRGIKGLAAQDLTATAVRATFLARLLRSRALPWTVAILGVAALLPSLYWARENGRLESELAAERSARQGPEASARSREVELRSRAAEAEGRANAERRERERLQAELDRATGPRTDLVSATLSPERSALSPNAEPSTRISVSRSTEWLVLSLELDLAERSAYRATLSAPGGANLWSGAGLVPDEQGTLHLALPTALLPAGDLSLRVDGVGETGGRPEPVARFSFRVAHVR